MDRRQDPAYAMRYFGLRFVHRDTEQAYRRWREVTGIAFVRIGYIGSLPSWTGVLIAVVVLDPAAADVASVWVAAWILLLFSLTLLTFPALLQRTVMPMAAAANTLAGFLIVWLMADVTLADQLDQSRAGV